MLGTLLFAALVQLPAQEQELAPGTRYDPSIPTLEDVVPTLCYLLDLPVAQYMEGRVILEAVSPDWLAEHPLMVVD